MTKDSWEILEIVTSDPKVWTIYVRVRVAYIKPNWQNRFRVWASFDLQNLNGRGRVEKQLAHEGVPWFRFQSSLIRQDLFVKFGGSTWDINKNLCLKFEIKMTTARMRKSRNSDRRPQSLDHQRPSLRTLFFSKMIQ